MNLSHVTPSCVAPQTCATVECWRLQCAVGQLQRGASVILSVHSRVWAETFVEVRAPSVTVTFVCT